MPRLRAERKRRVREVALKETPAEELARGRRTRAEAALFLSSVARGSLLPRGRRAAREPPEWLGVEATPLVSGEGSLCK